MTPEDVASSAARAGFTGDALVTIVAIAGRESGWNPDAIGDVGLETAVWGPSVGLYQIRTLKAATGTGADRDIDALMPGGRGDPDRQSLAAWSISGGGANFTPWSTSAGLTAAQLDQARQAVSTAATGAPGGSGAATTAGSVGGVLTSAIDHALGLVVGADTFTGWITEHTVRTVEVIAGGALLIVGLVMFLDVLTLGTDAAGNTTGLVGRTMRKARDELGPIVAAIAATGA